MKNAINWFEIPVTDFERAKKFYSVLVGEQLIDHPMPDDTMKYGVFPYETGGAGIGGAIVQGEGFVPSAEGSTIYLNGGEDLKIPLSRIEMAGGTVIMPKTSIGENGFMALFMDTEGNKVALHSMN
jgi:predicted enzyme related to lactoylglutathione lyase